MNLLKMENKDKDTIYINPVYIVDICPLPLGGSAINLVNATFEVNQTVEEVAMALRNL